MGTGPPKLMHQNKGSSLLSIVEECVVGCDRVRWLSFTTLNIVLMVNWYFTSPWEFFLMTLLMNMCTQVLSWMIEFQAN